MSDTFDVIVMITEDHLPTFKKMIPYCRKNIPVKSIFAIASPKLKKEIEMVPGITFVDENSVYSGLSYDAVQNIIENITGERKRAGWYLQQFLKMAWAYKSKDSRYISLDADTFVLNPIRFTEGDRYLFTSKTEYHKPYFNCINRLFGGSVKRNVDFSFIAENMVFDCKIMKEMITDIEKNEELDGNFFWEKILNAVDKDELIWSGFSEFETYGNYIFTRYPDKVKSRKLRTMREALVLLGGNPSSEQLSWASADYDVISVESIHYKKTLVTWLTSKAVFRRKVSMRKLAILRHKLRTAYRRACRKDDFALERYE